MVQGSPVLVLRSSPLIPGEAIKQFQEKIKSTLAEAQKASQLQQHNRRGNIF